MKKILSVFLTVMMLVLAISCSSSTTSEKQNKKVVGKNGIKMPTWVVKDISTKKELCQAGYGTGRTFETASKKARLDAEANLAQYVNNTVNQIKDRAVSETDSSADTSYYDEFTLQTKTLSSAVLTGVVEKDVWEDAEGGVWILLSVPKKNLKAQIQNAIKSTTAAIIAKQEGNKVVSEPTITTVTTTVEEPAPASKLNKALDEIIEAE